MVENRKEIHRGHRVGGVERGNGEKEDRLNRGRETWVGGRDGEHCGN